MVDVPGTSDRRSPHHGTGCLRSVTSRQDDDSSGKRSSSSRVTLNLEDDWSTRQQQDSVAVTSSKTSKATDDRFSRFHLLKESSNTDSASVSVVDQSSRSNGSSGTRGSDLHCSYSVKRGRTDRHHGSERRHYPGHVNI